MFARELLFQFTSAFCQKRMFSFNDRSNTMISRLFDFIIISIILEI